MNALEEREMKKMLALVLALVMALSLVACGNADNNEGDDGKKTFIMGIDPEYPPFSYLDENGEYNGFDVEICKAACESVLM